jgi:hypothetical protein
MLRSSLFSFFAICLLLLGGGVASSSQRFWQIKYPDNYISFSATAKRDWIWNQGILKTKFKTLPPFEDIKVFSLLFLSLSKKMNHQLDFVPRKWKKPIHRRSVVAKVKFVPATDSPLTGIYSQESIGLLRASLTYRPDKRGVAPGLALKMFVDGQMSRDVSFLNSLESQGQNYNFFAKPFSNFVPPAKSSGAKFISWIFRRAAKRTNYISADHLAEINPNGTKVDVNELIAPGKLVLKATSDDTNLPVLPKRDVRKDLMKIPAGTTLFEVYASNKIIGTIVLESNFIASQFGDDQLFFRHQSVSNL